MPALTPPDSGFASLLAFWLGGAGTPVINKSSSNALTFAPRSSATLSRGYSVSTSNALTFSPSSSEVRTAIAVTANVVTFTPVATGLSNHSFSVSTACRVVFRTRCRARAKEVVFADTYRGSLPQGTPPAVFLQARDGRGSPAIPTARVGLRAYRLGAGVVTTGDMTAVPHARSTAVFSGLGRPISSGRYFALEQWSIGGFAGLETSTFEVSAAGDVRGSVIAAHDFRRPEARHVLAQVEGGLVLEGRNPRDRP